MPSGLGTASHLLSLSWPSRGNQREMSEVILTDGVPPTAPCTPPDVVLGLQGCDAAQRHSAPGSVHSVTRSSKKMPVLHSSTRAAAKTKSWTQGDGRPSPQPKPARPKEGLPSHTHTWSDTGFESELNPKFPFGFKAELYQD